MVVICNWGRMQHLFVVFDQNFDVVKDDWQGCGGVEYCSPYTPKIRTGCNYLRQISYLLAAVTISFIDCLSGDRKSYWDCIKNVFPIRFCCNTLARCKSLSFVAKVRIEEAAPQKKYLFWKFWGDWRLLSKELVIEMALPFHDSPFIWPSHGQKGLTLECS